MPSTYSRMDIYNMALSMCGLDTIASPNERSPKAIQCELHWDVARRSALRDYPFRFALARAVLAEQDIEDVWSSEWQHVYARPDGCIKVLRVMPGSDTGHGEASGKKVVWKKSCEMRYEVIGDLIYTDAEYAAADCVMDVEDVSKWDELFCLVMSRKLACLIAVPLLKNNPQKLQELMTLYQQALPDAEGHDASEQNMPQDECPWLLARG